MASPKMPARRAWVTLLTQASYLPGVITLAYTLSLHRSAYPLVVLTTPAVPRSCMRALALEREYKPSLLIRPIKPLLLPSNQKTKLIDSRFEDTWTKLRAFELTAYDACVFLDADITIYRNMDKVFETSLLGKDWIAANHTCVCNLDHDSWAPPYWTPENCAYTPLQHPSSLYKAAPVPSIATPPDTHALLNGGLFLYQPSEPLWHAILHHFNTSSRLSTYIFPDQDFLADFFCHKRITVPWKYNALKTMENWHRNVWRDEEVHGLHYIVDKPWNRRVASDGIGGHLGRDGKTHSWWWRVWEQWKNSRDGELVDILQGLIAKPLTAEEDAKQCLENMRNGLPVPLERKSPRPDNSSDKENEAPDDDASLTHKMK